MTITRCSSCLACLPLHHGTTVCEWCYRYERERELHASQHPVHGTDGLDNEPAAKPPALPADRDGTD